VTHTGTAVVGISGPSGAKSSRGLAAHLYQALVYGLVTVVGLATGFPFLYLAFGSLTRVAQFRRSGVALLPHDWTLQWYQYLLTPGSPVQQALKVSFLVTIVGTGLSVLVTAALAYGLAKKDLPGRRILIGGIFFTLLFQRGMVPFYLIVRGLHLTETLWALMLPSLVNATYALVMYKFFQALPSEVEDAARLDGCSEARAFFEVLLPLCKPALATIGLFYAVDYWNEWFWAQIFLRDTQLHPLQLVLRRMLDDRVAPVRMAAIMLSALPIIALGLGLQRRIMGDMLFPIIKLEGSA